MARFIETPLDDLDEKQQPKPIPNRFIETPISTRASLLSVEDKDPDKSGKVLSLADKIGVPAELVEERYGSMDYMLGVSAYDTLQDTHPATAAVISKPDIASVAKDDIDNLKRIEESIGYAKRKKATAWMDSDRLDGPEEEDNTFRDWIRKTFPDAYKPLLAGVVQYDLARIGSMALLGNKPQDFDERSEKLLRAWKDLNAEPITSVLEGGVKGAIQILPQYYEQAKLAAWGAMAGGALGAVSTPYLGFQGLWPGMAAGAGTAVLAGSFDLEAGLAYMTDLKDIKDTQGNPIPENVRRIAAGIIGVINAGWEAAQFAGIAKLFPGVGKKIVKESVLRATTELVKRYGGTVLTNTGQEVMQRLTNLVVEDLTKTFLEKTEDREFVHKTVGEVGQALLDEASQSIVTFGVLGLPGVAASMKPTIDSVQSAQRNADVFNAINDALNGNLTRDRYPPAIRELALNVKAQAQLDGEEIGDIYIPASALQTLFQDDPVALQEFLTTAEVKPGEYGKALESDGDVEIPLEVYAQKIAGSTYSQKLANDIRLFPNASTVNEAKQNADYLKSILEQRETEGLTAMAEDADLKAEVERIKEGIALEGMDQKDVESHLAVLAARAKVAAQAWTQVGKSTTPADIVRQLTVRQGAAPDVAATPQERLNQGTIVQGDVTTPEFKAWFGDSKVVDESGKPLKVFHGTTVKFDSFQIGLDQAIWFSSDISQAKQFPLYAENSDRKIRSVYLSINNPLLYDAKGEEFDPEWVNPLIEQAKSEGKDGIIIKDIVNFESGPSSTSFVVFNPEQVKSVKNRGAWSPESPNILEQDQPSGLRGSITFTETGPIIDLFKGQADFSTFLHEMGHWFIRDMENIVATGKAPESIVKDLQTLRDFVSDQPDERAKQEKLAKAFEAYLLEGKAPTLELQSAFYRFRSWLSAIYRSLKSVLGVEINDEVRGVFDRMLQAEDDIAAADAYQDAKTSIDQLVEELATHAEKAKLQKLKDKSRKTAIERRTATLLRAYKSAIGGRPAFIKQATARVKALRVYQAIDDAEASGGLLVPSEEDRAVKTINKKHGSIASTQGKIGPEVLAAKYGYSSVDEMLAEMRKADPIQKAVNKETRKLISEAEKRIHSEALAEQYGVTFQGDEEFHSEAQLDYLVAVAELLRRKTAQQKKGAPARASKAALLDRVRQDLGSKPLKEALRYTKASAAESRASRAFELALRDGNNEEALKQKQLQAYYHAMVLESVRSREEIAKRVKQVGKALKRLDSIEDSHREQFLALANRYGLTNRKPTDAANMEGFESFVNRAFTEDPTGVPYFEPWILKGEKAGNYRDLTLDEAREVFSAINWLSGRGSDQLQQMLTDQSISIATYADKAQREAHGVRSKDIPEERQRFYHLRRKINGGLSKISQFQFYLMAMDGYKNKDGTTPGPNEQMFRWLADAGSKEKRIFYEVLWPQYNTAFKQLRLAQKRIEARLGTFFDVTSVPVTDAMRAVGATSWTSERVIAAALNMGNEGNLLAMLSGYELTYEQLESLVSVLTEDDWKAIQGIWDLIDTQYAPMDAAYFQINNKHTKKVEARPFKIRVDGNEIEILGGYYPLIFDHKLSDRAEKFLQEDLLKNSEQAVTHSPVTRSGFINMRTGGLLPPKLSLGIILQHLYDTVHYYTHAAVVSDIDRITRVPEWKQEFIRILGRDAYAEIRPFLKSVARPERTITDVYDDFLTRQRMLASIAILGMNLKTASKQFLDFAAAARDLGPIYVGRGIASSWGNWSDAAAEVRLLSPYMAQRKLAIDREMREVLTRSTPGKRTFTIHGEEYSWNDVETFAFKFIEMADAAVTIPVWKAAYSKASDLRMSPEDCIKYADNAVRTSQASADIIDMTALQRAHNWTRLFSMFISPGLRKQNRMRYFYGAWRNNKITSGEYFRHVAYELLAPSVARWFFYALFLGSAPWDDDDDRAPVSDIAFNFLEECVGGYPIVNMIPSAIQYSRGSPSPALEGLDRVKKLLGSTGGAIGSIWDDEKDIQEEWLQFAVSMADLMTFQMGIGYAPRVLKTFADGFEDLFIENRTYNPLRFIIRVPKKDREGGE